jgi:hypothetical protein
MPSNPILQAALAYASRGLAIFPVPPGTKKSYKSAAHSGGRAWGMTRDADEIRRDFAQWPDAGIGIPTGAINGIIVVETDTVAGGHAHDGDLALAELEAEHGALPDTLQAVSPSGSIHRYFRHPGGGIKIKNSCSEIAPGIDVRGDGGMVVAPPTLRPGVGRYHWRNRLPIAAMPAWLVELTRDKPRSISQRAVATMSGRPDINTDDDRSNAYGAAALEYEIGALSQTADGQRNAALNRASFSLHQLVAGGELDGHEVERALIRACEINGLMADRNNGGIKNIIGTIRSGARAGLQRPRGRR